MPISQTWGFLHCKEKRSNERILQAVYCLRYVDYLRSNLMSYLVFLQYSGAQSGKTSMFLSQESRLSKKNCFESRQYLGTQNCT